MGDVRDDCPRCHGERWVTVNNRHPRDPQWDEDVPCPVCTESLWDDDVVPDDYPVDVGPPRPGDHDWADPWDR